MPGLNPASFCIMSQKSLVGIFDGLVDPEACGVSVYKVTESAILTAVTDDPRLAEAVPGGSDKAD